MIEIPKQLKSSLKNIGMDSAQIQAVFFLFQNGISSIAAIAGGVKLPRSTIHLAVESLVERGVLGVTASGKRRVFYVENPEKIRKFLEHEELETRKKVSELELVMPELRSLFALRGESEKIDIEHLEGEDGFVKVFMKSLDQEKGGEVLRMSGDPERFTVARDRLKEYRELRIKRKIKTKLLLPEFPDIDDERLEARIKFREVRALPKAIFNSNLQMSVWTDHVALTVWDKGLHSVIITNRSIAMFMRMLFDIAWNQAQ
ncbi:MAG: transcriptional regulator TrmB [Patescibacteria group bacterium]|nr:transcriptional regulator TrmB [Patescibacteria group bacterium]